MIRYGIPGLPDDSGNAVSANTDSPAAEADSRIALDLRASDGRVVEGTIVEMVGSDLEQGSTFALRLFEPEMLLTEGTVPPSGNLLEQFRLPGGLAPGTYTLEFSVRGPGGDTLALHRVFEVSAEGAFLDVGVNAVGLKAGVVTPEKLAYTGMSSTSLPWWAISVLVMGLLLVLYSVRARQLVDALDLSAVEPGERTPWEILATPIRVPGIDYRAGSSGGHLGAASLNETIHELDIALSRLVVRRLDQVTHLFGRN